MPSAISKLFPESLQLPRGIHGLTKVTRRHINSQHTFIIACLLMLLRKYIPPFLRALDRRLLLYRPLIWSAQVHLLGFWAMSLSVLAVASSFMMPAPLHSLWQIDENQILMGMVFSVLSVLLLGSWLYSQRTYRVEGKQGVFTVADARRRSLLYSAGILLAALPALLSQFSWDYRKKKMLSTEELIEEIQLLDTYELYFPTREREEFLLPTSQDYASQVSDLLPLLPEDERERVYASSMDYWMKVEAMGDVPGGTLEGIEDYLEVVRKYAGEGAYRGLDAEKALENFKEGHVYGESHSDHFIPNTLDRLREYQETGWLTYLISGEVPFFTVLLMLLLSNAFLIASYLGAKQSIMALLGNLLTYVGSAILTGMFGLFGLGMWSFLFSLAFPVFVFAIVISINRRSQRNQLSSSLHKFGLALLGAGHIYAILFMFGLFGMVSAFWFPYSSNFQAAALGLLAAEALHLWLVLPSFHKAYLRLKSQPER